MGPNHTHVLLSDENVYKTACLGIDRVSHEAFSREAHYFSAPFAIVVSHTIAWRLASFNLQPWTVVNA